jgi:hypothetical protein
MGTSNHAMGFVMLLQNVNTPGFSPRLQKQRICKIAVTAFDPLEEAISDHDLKDVFNKSST